MSVQIIRSQSGDEMVILPKADYDRLCEMAENSADIRAAGEILARLHSGAEETVPAAVASRLAGGENPVKVWRDHRQMTQEQLAAAAGMSKMYLSQIERGERRGSVRMLRRLADILAVGLDDLAE